MLACLSGRLPSRRVTHKPLLSQETAAAERSWLAFLSSFLFCPFFLCSALSALVLRLNVLRSRRVGQSIETCERAWTLTLALRNILAFVSCYRGGCVTAHAPETRFRVNMLVFETEYRAGLRP